MEDGGHLPPDGGGGLGRSSPAGCGAGERAVGGERGGPGTSTPMRVGRDDLCGVPRGVPRFQCVDFPSLHQCIQQLSVPPLNGWLGSCSLAKAPNYRPASPKEKVPKFKYVDYPSLHHCIQQLSVPPLESWSAGLVGFDAEGGQRRPSRVGTVGKSQGNDGGGQDTQDRSRGTAFTFERDTHSSVSGREEAQQRMERSEPEAGLRSECSCGFESGSGSQSNTAVTRNVRPSVISMVHTDGQKHWTESDHLEEQLNSPDSVGRVPWSALPESVCPFCQRMFADPERFGARRRSHRDERPN